MKEEFYPSNEYDSTEAGPVHDFAVRAVLESKSLTKDEKRALLSSWASDRRAVENHPALRRRDDGSLVEIDAILEALKQLDGAEERPSPEAVGRRRPHRTLRSWIARRRHDDDDDDPPTAPAALPWPRPAPLADASALTPAA